MKRIVLGTCAALMGAAALTLSVAGAQEARYSWQRAQAKVSPTGGLEWAPLPFEFVAGDVVRYIDFEAGDDNAAGTKAAPWKHHPWDGNATGNAKAAKGVATYVFKRGVIYRGYMRSPESGEPGDPIRFTSDPDWGTGEALIYGSVPVPGTWKKCTPADAPGIPDPGKVWYNDLGMDFDKDRGGTKLGALWQVDGDKATRIHIAKDPNWTITDPDDVVKDWYTWDSFTGASNNGTIVDKRWVGKPKDFFEGVTCWSQHRGLMGTVHKISLSDFNPATGGFKVSAPGGTTFRRGGNPRQPYNLGGRVHYYMEDVPAFLDTPGEYYFDEATGRLFLRLPDDGDPNEVVLEAAQVRSPIAVFDQSNIEVSGLTFRFNDNDDGLYGYPWYISASPGVRIVGNCSNITVRNCKFYDVMNAVVAFPRPQGGEGGPPAASVPDIGKFANDVMDNIVITDNDVLNCDKFGAIWVNGNSEREKGEPYGVLGRVEVMRNRVVNSGYRPGKTGTSSLPAICVNLPSTAEIAGNIVDTSWGNGIFTVSGKGSGSFNDVPLTRMLIHHNLAENTMLGCNDYGGIELFQGGPAYIYNNISRNTVGTKTFTGSELGYNLYLDGGFKVYSFNNILAGRVDEDPNYYGHCGYFMVFGFMDHLFNNTIYRFEYGLNGSSGNRSCILGNVIANCSKSFMAQNRPGDVSMMGGGDTGEMGRMGIATMVYGDNIFYGDPKGGRDGEGAFGFVGGISTSAGRGDNISGNTIEEMRQALEGMNARVSSIGEHVEVMPLSAPAQYDYSIGDGSPAVDQGVKFFVPWGLSRMVGEWNFYKSPHVPEVVLGENFYMSPELMQRGQYYFVPRNDLVVSSCTPEDYVDGPLEDWTEGALQFDGKTRFAVLTHAEMTKDMTYPGSVDDRGRFNSGRGQTTFKGEDRRTLDMKTNNFLVEVFFQADAAGFPGVLASKTDGKTGYELALQEGNTVVLTVLSGGRASSCFGGKLADGWHHVIAEVERQADKAVARIYVDGKQAGRADMPLTADVSLSNTADFFVGKGHDGRFLKGAIDFLRVSQGTLEDAQTTIDELYEWEFNGPHLRDFAGRTPKGKRDAGALEAP